MERVKVRVVGRSIRGKGAGEVIALSRRDARLLSRLGRVEALDGSDDEPTPAKQSRRTPVRKAKPAKNAPARKETLLTPEAELETVAHDDPPAKRSQSKRRKAK